jgi:hypothetical protein
MFLECVEFLHGGFFIEITEPVEDHKEIMVEDIKLFLTYVQMITMLSYRVI